MIFNLLQSLSQKVNGLNKKVDGLIKNDLEQDIRGLEDRRDRLEMTIKQEERQGQPTDKLRKQRQETISKLIKKSEKWNERHGGRVRSTPNDLLRHMAGFSPEILHVAPKSVLKKMGTHTLSASVGNHPSFNEIKDVMRVLNAPGHPSYQHYQKLYIRFHMPDHASYGHLRVKYPHLVYIKRADNKPVREMKRRLGLFEVIIAPHHPSRNMADQFLAMLKNPDHPSHNISWAAYYRKGQGVPTPWDQLWQDWDGNWNFEPFVFHNQNFFRSTSEMHRVIKKNWERRVSELEIILPNHPSRNQIADYLRLLRNPHHPSGSEYLDAIEAYELSYWVPSHFLEAWPHTEDWNSLHWSLQQKIQSLREEISLAKYVRPRWTKRVPDLKLTIQPSHPSYVKASAFLDVLRNPNHPSIGEYADAVQAFHFNRKNRPLPRRKPDWFGAFDPWYGTEDWNKFTLEEAIMMWNYWDQVNAAQWVE